MSGTDVRKALPSAEALAGIGLGAAGIAMLCSMDALVKGLGSSLPLFEIVFVRYLGAALWLAVYISAFRRAWPQRRYLGQHILRGLTMSVTACLFFYGITHLPLALAAALAMSAPIYVSVFGIVFLKEPPSRYVFVALALGIAGSGIIILGGAPLDMGTRPDLSAWGAAIMAPLAYAGSLVLMKHHANGDGAAAMTLAQSLVAGLIFLPLAGLSGFSIPAPGVMLRVLLVGLFGALGFIFIISGLRRLPASTFATLDYTGLLWAALFGFVFFGETVGLRFWIGGGLIIAGCAVAMLSARTPEPASPVTSI